MVKSPPHKFQEKANVTYEQYFRAMYSRAVVLAEELEQTIGSGKVPNCITMYCTHTGEYQSIPATGKRIARAV